MDDRVGDILAQRAKLESGIGAAIFLSILFHATLTALAGWSAWHHSSTASTAVMTIRFAQPQPTAEITPAAQPVLDSVTPTTPKPIEKPKPSKKTAPPSPFGKSTKKAAEPVPQPQQPSNPVTQQPEVPVGGSGVTQLEGGDFPYTIYIERMKTLIGSHFFRPAVADSTTAIVYFVIDRDGTIRDTKVQTESGNGLYDRAALRAVLEASPLPPLPFGYSGTYLGVHLKFR
ncbi:MAG TPA: TonB family protein [Thermoanaerobaculia bacterium]|nr:TonB family protein [Thermoanaerobaculia bacterium]